MTINQTIYDVISVEPNSPYREMVLPNRPRSKLVLVGELIEISQLLIPPSYGRIFPKWIGMTNFPFPGFPMH